MAVDQPAVAASPSLAAISNSATIILMAARALCRAQLGIDFVYLLRGALPLISQNVSLGSTPPLTGLMFCSALNVAGYKAFMPRILSRLDAISQNMAKENYNESPLNDLLNGIKYCLADCLDLQAVAIDPQLMANIDRESITMNSKSSNASAAKT